MSHRLKKKKKGKGTVVRCGERKCRLTKKKGKTGENYTGELRKPVPPPLHFPHACYFVCNFYYHPPPPTPMGVRGIPRVLVCYACVFVCVCSVSLCFLLLFLLHRLATQRVIATFPLHCKKMPTTGTEIN